MHGAPVPAYSPSVTYGFRTHSLYSLFSNKINNKAVDACYGIPLFTRPQHACHQLYYTIQNKCYSIEIIFNHCFYLFNIILSLYIYIRNIDVYSSKESKRAVYR